MKATLSIACAALCALTGCAADPVIEQGSAPVIYGTDGRQDYYEATDPAFAELLRGATVAMVDPQYIDVSDPGNVVPDTITLGVYKNLCPGERFAEQPAMASCSGTLIDDDLVLTAAHCVDQTVCDDWYFVFGFYMRSATELHTLTAADVYSCAEVLVQEYTTDAGAPTWHDYAIVRLARPVVGRSPAPVLMERNQIQVGHGITALGFGNGIPGKIHTGGTVLLANESWGYFRGSTDTFSGNSGSGTYNDAHQLVGIFVRGSDADYTSSGGGCDVVNTLGNTAGTQEYDYAYKAVTALCETGYASRRLCGTEPSPGPGPDPGPSPAPKKGGGCRIGSGDSPGLTLGLCLWILALIALLRRRGDPPQSV